MFKCQTLLIVLKKIDMISFSKDQCDVKIGFVFVTFVKFVVNNRKLLYHNCSFKVTTVVD